MLDVDEVVHRAFFNADAPFAHLPTCRIPQSRHTLGIIGAEVGHLRGRREEHVAHFQMVILGGILGSGKLLKTRQQWRSHLHFALTRPGAYFGTLFTLLTRPHPDLGSRWMTLLHFGEGVCVAGLLAGRSYDHIHAHFLDRASMVALVASRLVDVSYSLTAHAADIYVRPVLAREKSVQFPFLLRQRLPLPLPSRPPR